MYKEFSLKRRTSLKLYSDIFLGISILTTMITLFLFMFNVKRFLTLHFFLLINIFFYALSMNEHYTILDNKNEKKYILLSYVASIGIDAYLFIALLIDDQILNIHVLLIISSLIMLFIQINYWFLNKLKNISIFGLIIVAGIFVMNFLDVDLVFATSMGLNSSMNIGIFIMAFVLVSLLVVYYFKSNKRQIKDIFTRNDLKTEIIEYFILSAIFLFSLILIPDIIFYFIMFLIMLIIINETAQKSPPLMFWILSLVYILIILI